MTVSTTDSLIEYTGNASATTFPVPFMFLANADLVVTSTSADGLTTTTLVSGTDYSVIGAGAPSGGAIITTAAPATGVTIAISRELDPVQETDLRNQGRFYAETHESVFDRLIMLIQQLFSALGRALARPIGKKYFDAEGLQIKNLADPTAAQDAATLNWAQQYIANILKTGQGPVNNAANVVYTGPDGSATNLQQLSGSTGASLLGYGLGTIEQALEAAVPFSKFGAFGTGADETAAVKLAIAYSMSTGKMIDGLGKTYGVTGNLSASGVLRMRNATFKAMSPDGVSLRTVYFTSGTLCELVKVKVDRNGTGAGGQINNSAGIYVNAATLAILDGCEAYGNNFGDGIVVVDSKVRIKDTYVHDMTYGTTSSSAQTDDVMQGLLLVRCQGDVRNHRSERLQGQWSGQAVFPRFTRGLALAGCYDLTVSACTSDTVDQGFDYSGGENNRRISTVGCHAMTCYTWGFKAANTVTDSVYTGCVAYRCGLGGYVASAPTSTLTGVTSAQLTQSILYQGCVAYQTGYGGGGALGVPKGFQALNSTAYTDFPRGIKWSGCRSYGGTTCQYGFWNAVPVAGTSELYNEAVGCDSKDHVTAGFYGMNEGSVKLRYTLGTLSLTSGATAVAVPWNLTVEDKMNTGSTRIIRRSGNYLIDATATFAANANGIRRISIYVNDAAVLGATWHVKPDGTDPITANATKVVALNAGDRVDVYVYQNSGSAIVVSAAILDITELSKGQS